MPDKLTSLERREKILNQLSLEPRLTAKHLAYLTYPTEKTKQVNGRTYPSTYQSANNMLRRMADRKELKVHELSRFGYPDLFMLNATERLKSIEKILHEMGGANLYLAYRPFIEKWAYEPLLGSKRADRGMQYRGSTFYFEVDRCTENIGKLFEKVDNYIQYSAETKERFHVIFAFMGDKEKVFKRGKKLIPYLEEAGQDNQFLMVNLQKLLKDPFGEVIYSPLGELISLHNLVN